MKFWLARLIGNQRALVELARAGTSPEARARAVRHVRNPDVLLELAMVEKNGDVCRAAIEALALVDSQQAFVALARTCPNPWTRQTAVARVKNQDVLREVAANDKELTVRNAATVAFARAVFRSAAIDDVLVLEPLFDRAAVELRSTIGDVLGREWADRLREMPSPRRRVFLLLSGLLAAKDVFALIEAGSVLCALRDSVPDGKKALMLWNTRDQTRHIDGSASDVDRDDLYLCDDGSLVICTTRGRSIAGVDWDDGGSYRLSAPKTFIAQSGTQQIVASAGEGFALKLATRILDRLDPKWVSQPPAGIEELKRRR